MDKERQIRFLYPPFFFILSFYFGASLGDTYFVQQIDSFFRSLKDNIILTILSVSSFVLTLGFLIGTITIFLLRVLFIFNRFNYEILLSNKSYDKIGSIVFKKSNDKMTKSDKFFAGVVFDHEFMPKSIHAWCVRRWNSFLISCSIVISLILAILLGMYCKIPIENLWINVTIFLVLLFCIQAYISWKHTMKMIEFAIRIKTEDNELSNPNLNDDLI